MPCVHSHAALQMCEHTPAPTPPSPRQGLRAIAYSPLGHSKTDLLGHPVVEELAKELDVVPAQVSGQRWQHRAMWVLCPTHAMPLTDAGQLMRLLPQPLFPPRCCCAGMCSVAWASSPRPAAPGTCARTPTSSPSRSPTPRRYAAGRLERGGRSRRDTCAWSVPSAVCG